MKKATIITLTLIFVLCFPAYAYAYAYLDLGTGSYFLQIIVATLLGAMYAIKQFWYKIKLFCINIFSKFKKRP